MTLRLRVSSIAGDHDVYRAAMEVWRLPPDPLNADAAWLDDHQNECDVWVRPDRSGVLLEPSGPGPVIIRYHTSGAPSRVTVIEWGFGGACLESVTPLLRALSQRCPDAYVTLIHGGTMAAGARRVTADEALEALDPTGTHVPFA